MFLIDEPIHSLSRAGTLEEDVQEAFVREVVRVGRDAEYFYVRREASLALGALAKVVSQELVDFSLVRRIYLLGKAPG